MLEAKLGQQSAKERYVPSWWSEMPIRPSEMPVLQCNAAGLFGAWMDNDQPTTEVLIGSEEPFFPVKGGQQSAKD